MAQEVTVDVSYTILDVVEDLTSGILCVVAKPNHSTGDVVSPTDLHDDKWCLGAGISYGPDNSGRYAVRINGIEYKFNKKGKPATPEATDLQCYLAKSNKAPIGVGSVAGSMKDITAVRKEDGTVDYQTEGDITSIAVDNLNARDQFALKVLQGFLDHIDNPASLSSNEMSFYCDKAYEWASYLMTTAAMSRASVRSESQSESGEKDINLDDLTTNTEILLNNLIVELKKSDLTETIDDNEVTSKLITLRQFPELLEVLPELVAAVRDLKLGISAQASSLTQINASIDAQNSGFAAISNSLQGIAEALSDITVTVTYTDELNN